MGWGEDAQSVCTVDARYVYQHEGRTSLGKGPMLGILGAGKWVRSKGHAMKSQWNAAVAAVDLMQVRYNCSRHALDHVDMDHVYNDPESQCILALLPQTPSGELIPEALQPCQRHHFALHE